MQISSVLTEFGGAVLDFLFPPSCFGCGKFLEKHSLLCTDCENEIERTHEPICFTCGLPLPFGQDSCSDCSNEGILFYRTFAEYTETVRHLIHAFKYYNRDDIGGYFGSHLGETVMRESVFAGFDLCIGVPLYPTRKRERGYNQSDIIAGAISKKSGIPHATTAVRRVKPTKSQTKLNLEQRQKNVSNIFKISKPEDITGKNVIIIDDVITTGSTIKSLANVLIEAGAEKICAVSISHPSIDD